MLLILLTILSNNQDLTMDLDEIFVDGLTCSVTDEKRTAWVAMRRDGPRMIGELYIFDHASQKATLVSDGRVHISGRTYISKVNEGYALINVSARTVFFIDAKGVFLDKLPFEHLEGYEPDYQILAAVPMQKEVAITFREGNDWSKLLLAELNLEHRQFGITHVLENAPEMGAWVFDGKAWLFLDQKTGRVDLLDPYFKVSKTLIPDHEPRLSVKNKRVASLMRERGISPYSSYFQGFFQNKEMITTWGLDWLAEEVKWSQLLIENGKVSTKKGGSLILATLPGHDLIFDRNEGEFLLQKRN